MILDEIIDHKRREVDLLKKNLDISSMISAAHRLPPAISLSRALKNPGRVSLVAEIKSASPSGGVLREDFDPVRTAHIYSENGADAISVLTDSRFFGGSADHLSRVRQVTSLPVLRKDFLVDPIQVYQARLMGSDAVLLICAVLAPKDLAGMMKAAGDLGMEALVEVHDIAELEAALDAGAGIIGINNRDLKTFKTDINTTFRLYEELKGSPAVVVSESGIKTAEDMSALKNAGVNAALVGEAIMRAGDMAAKVRELRYGQ
ncbi:MAG: indole-3-glycerol phosphate synthase TrpC [Firmicutes bacterium]|nr:indole-3-glycerol phosphate synthase TrpC [Bacillota bacterium]